MTDWVGIDLFAGAGGMSLGATQAGIKVALAVEIDQRAAETYRKNHPNTAVFAKGIQELTPYRIRSVRKGGRRSIVFGGPPCRGFSYSNLRTRSATNADTTGSMM